MKLNAYEQYSLSSDTVLTVKVSIFKRVVQAITVKIITIQWFLSW